MNWFPYSERLSERFAQWIRFRHLPWWSKVSKGSLWFLPLAVVIGVLGLVSSSEAARVRFRFSGFPDARGELAYALFNQTDGFPSEKSKALKRGFVPVPVSLETEVVLDGVTPGEYAASAYQDWNGNRQLDKNLLGMPREPVGASNNPHNRLGPPTFKECVFQVVEPEKIVEIKLVRGVD